MRRIIQTDGGSKSKERDERVKASSEASALDSRIELIQMLIPLGLKAVAEELEAEVERLVGARYSRENPDQKRWGTNPGSVFLGEQKVAVQVPRVRDVGAIQLPLQPRPRGFLRLGITSLLRNPQSFAGFTYVISNPTNRIDPFGYCGCYQCAPPGHHFLEEESPGYEDCCIESGGGGPSCEAYFINVSRYRTPDTPDPDRSCYVSPRCAIYATCYKRGPTMTAYLNVVLGLCAPDSGWPCLLAVTQNNLGLVCTSGGRTFSWEACCSCAHTYGTDCFR